MRTRTFTAAAAVGLFAYLCFQLVHLEAHVAGLAKQLGTISEAAPAAPINEPRSASSSTYIRPDFQQRLATLEREVHELRVMAERLEKNGPRGAPARDEKEILSVVERENNRVKDVQLEWSRARWGESRDAELISFAQQYSLTSGQTAAIQKALRHEVDGMVEVMKRPDLLEDPDQTAADWQLKLDATDAAAAQVLNPTQLDAWNKVRTFERRVLWPWLPSQPTKQ